MKKNGSNLSFRLAALLLCLLGFSSQTHAQTPVQKNGQLQVIGTKLCNQYGNPIQLRGMSTHGIQWYGWGSCLTAASLDALAYDWGADILRISLYVQEGGYETDPTGFTNQVNRLIEEATARGMYALVDWHQLTPGDPNANLARAKTFFSAIANTHKNKNNIIYDICNEPNSGATWAKIKTYADQMIPFIRAIDNDAVILVGTHGWSTMGLSGDGSLQDIFNNPLTHGNVMYTFHFYAKDHRTAYLNQLNTASDRLPVFVTEFGTQEASGDGANDFAMAQQYIDLMARKKISWTNWNYSDDFRSGAVWITGTCSNGPWTTARLKPAGAWIRERILNPADDFPGGNVCVPVSASANDGNVPANVQDNDYNTRWSAEGDGQWIQFCLDNTTTVSGVNIAFYSGTVRRTFFDILTSTDGSNWVSAASGLQSSGTSNALEAFTFTPRSAKHVRIVGHGNSASAWNSLTEVRIITTSSTQQSTLAPLQDAYVRNGDYAAITHGTTDATVLASKINATATTGYDRQSFLRFDVSGVNNISSAVLKVYGKIEDNRVANLPIGVYAVANTSWTESALTWNNKPATGSTALQTAVVTDSVGRYYSWDITNYVQTEKAAGRNGISLALLSNTGADPRVIWRSKEAGLTAPQLVIASTPTAAKLAASAPEKAPVKLITTLTSYPNPFDDNSTVSFFLDKPADVLLAVYDINGKQVAILKRGRLDAGQYNTSLAASHLPKGIYTLKLTYGEKAITRKVVKQ
ncbi:cellulase family glycosylhydrolase [Chitinophaga pinensis]|uniref:Cellulase n=1 Tax=Chitinophaga pinensis (strain ATCC 43595 / DSM 2588 / LMG 13176 / NBRC 15968 / NCIMB 11800 / UQM 2034) TaxID=485918 RepID=A0A979G2B2_CHIPD|nr:cellulase family glycosylhydrolase [Chitinophaga pinensis]ACU59504.1 Cellulase [Chitinophaga pinensis DSM 2588]